MLGKDLSTLLKTELYSDSVLECDSEVFTAHKAILAARSPFFEALFEAPPFDESFPDVFVIEDMKPEILSLVLEYIYSDEIGQLKAPQTAFDLLSAADRCQLPHLKEICVDYLKATVSEQNAFSILKCAELYDAGLKNHVIHFICDHFAVLKTTEWETIVVNHPSLAIDVINSKIDRMSSELRMMSNAFFLLGIKEK